MDYFNKWVKEVFFPNTGNTIVLLDSRTRHYTITVEKQTPAGKTAIPKVILKGTIGMIQPLTYKDSEFGQILLNVFWMIFRNIIMT